MEHLLGVEVYNKRTGVRGVISAYDSLTLTIDCGGIDQVVTYSTYKRWWIEVPADQPQVDDVIAEVVAEPEPVKTEEGVLLDPNAEKVTGIVLRNKFLQHLDNLLDDELTYVYNEKMKAYIIRYRGFNIFEVYASKKKLTVLAHPESLAPANKKRVDKIYPKEYGWALRAKFVFDTYDIGAAMIMKSIISDGLFYRSQRNQPK